MPIRHILRVDELTNGWSRLEPAGNRTKLALMVTQLGSTRVVMSAAVGVGAFASVRSRSWRPALGLAVTVGGQNAIYNLVKRSVNRSRPDEPHRAAWTGPSFPSGHTATAGAAWPAMLSVAAPGAGLVAKVAAYSAGPLVGATRVLLGVHWLSDVIAGLGLGWGWLALTRRFLRTRGE